jgi:hypothetical protein
MNVLRKRAPLAIDTTAQSASPLDSAFIAPPAVAPVDHDFVAIHGLAADGFTFGKITDFDAEPGMQETAHVIEPDGSRADFGLGTFTIRRNFQE